MLIKNHTTITHTYFCVITIGKVSLLWPLIIFQVLQNIARKKSFNIKKSLFKFKGFPMSWLVSGGIYWKFSKLQSFHVNLITFIIHLNTDIILIDMQIRWHSKKINVKLCMVFYLIHLVTAKHVTVYEIS